MVSPVKILSIPSCNTPDRNMYLVGKNGIVFNTDINQYNITYDGGSTWAILATDSSTVSSTIVTSSTQSMVDSASINRYIINSASTCSITLPTMAIPGHSFEIIGGRSAGWVIGQNAAQSIQYGSSITTSGPGGSISSAESSDCIILVCTTTNLDFTGYGSQGRPDVI